MERPKDALLGTWWDRGETKGLSGALARFLASSRKRDKAERRCAVARVRGSRVEWTVHGSLAVAVNWPLNTAFRLGLRSTRSGFCGGMLGCDALFGCCASTPSMGEQKTLFVRRVRVERKEGRGSIEDPWRDRWLTMKKMVVG